MQEYQQRVIEEKKELDIKISKLGSFIFGERVQFAKLLPDEKERLNQQYRTMSHYSAILQERIWAFDTELT